MKLTRAERLILSNQYRTLEKVDPKGDWDQAREVVDRGFELEYEEVASHVYGGNSAMTEAECMEVIDTMSMYWALKRTYEELSLGDRKDIDERGVKFAGFDGNNETKQMMYARFLVDQKGKFSGLDRVDDFNSHGPSLEVYRRMLPVWRQSADKFKTTKDDLVRITAARIHPSQRKAN